MSDPTIEQVRAANASAAATRVDADQSEGFKKKYRSYVDRIGPTIVMSGLGQALAIERAATTPEHDELYSNIAQWLCGDEGVFPQGQDLLESLMAGTQDDYLLAQGEALAWLSWHKKFCRALLPREAAVGDNE